MITIFKKINFFIFSIYIFTQSKIILAPLEIQELEVFGRNEIINEYRICNLENNFPPTVNPCFFKDAICLREKLSDQGLKSKRDIDIFLKKIINSEKKEVIYLLFNIWKHYSLEKIEEIFHILYCIDRNTIILSKDNCSIESDLFYVQDTIILINMLRENECEKNSEFIFYINESLKKLLTKIGSCLVVQQGDNFIKNYSKNFKNNRSINEKYLIRNPCVRNFDFAEKRKAVAIEAMIDVDDSNICRWEKLKYYIESLDPSEKKDIIFKKYEEAFKLTENVFNRDNQEIINAIKELYEAIKKAGFDNNLEIKEILYQIKELALAIEYSLIIKKS